ncbi:MAG: hypothetical protein IKE55_03225 [Kiritimatiellae bacterium]|nr:hypothetical protein [Kiritimatiellia bacterium]
MSNFIDIEDALQARLNAQGFNACAKPLPQGFRCPHVCVDMLNAWDDNAAQAVYSVDLDCRAETYDGAARLQLDASNLVRALPGSDLGGKPCYAVDSIRMQRIAPDKSHQNVILATVSAQLRVRVAD